MKRFLRPAGGRRVLDPATRRELAPEGLLVEDSEFWRRRLADGDVIEATAPAAEGVGDGHQL